MPEESTPAIPIEHQSSPFYYPALDGLRGVAILAVIIFHSGVQIVPSGAIGVDMFFVLSGFFITSVLLKERTITVCISLRNFYARRALRLLPAFFAFVAVVALFPRLFAGSFGLPPWKAYAATLFYLANWTRAFSRNVTILGILGVTWSLAIEEQFYLLWPPVVAISLRLGVSRVRIALALICAIVAIAAWRIWLATHGALPQRINNGFDTRADALLFGCALAFVPLSRTSEQRTLRRMIRCGAIAGTLFILAFLPVRVGNDFYFAAGMMLVSLSTAAIIAAEAAGVVTPVLTQILKTRWLRWIGRISYSVYLWHLVVYTIKWPIPEWFNFSFSVSALGHMRNVSISTLWMARLLGAILAGALSFYAIERPFLRLKRYFASAQRPSAPGCF